MLDFSNRNKKTLTIKLHNGKVIHVYTPTIKNLGNLSRLNVSELDIENACDVLAKILSNNLERYKVTNDIIGAFDMGELEELIEGIIDFVSGVKNEKN